MIINLDGIRTRNRWIRSPTRYPIAPQGLLIYINAMKKLVTADGEIRTRDPLLTRQVQ